MIISVTVDAERLHPITRGPSRRSFPAGPAGKKCSRNKGKVRPFCLRAAAAILRHATALYAGSSRGRAEEGNRSNPIGTWASSEVRCVGMRHRFEAVVEMVVVVLRAGDFD